MKRARPHHLGKPPRAGRPPQGKGASSIFLIGEEWAPDTRETSWDRLIAFHVAWARRKE
jgi:hypothetical protein